MVQTQYIQQKCTALCFQLGGIHLNNIPFTEHQLWAAFSGSQKALAKAH